MQTAEQLQTVTNGNTPHLSGYDLTLLLLRGGIGRLGLNSNAKEVLLYLASCYNEKNGVVYPRVKTMAAALDISERGVIRALAELTEKGCIIRSKRRKNSNEYVITRKVLQSNPIQHQTKNADNVITHGHNDTSSNDTVSPLMIHEVEQHEVKQQQPVKKADVVSISSFSLKKIPASILAKKTDKNGRPIRNHAAYWNSLTDAQKREYLKNEAEAAKRKEERKKQEEAEKQRKIEEQRQIKENANKPLSEQWSRERAIRQIWITKNLRRGMITGFIKSLADLYNLDVRSIEQMSESEIEKFSS